MIDDGSHRVEHPLASFDVLFPARSEHGLYPLVDPVMYWPKAMAPGDWPKLTTFPKEASWVDRSVSGVAFHRWLVFILRGRNPEDSPFGQPVSDA